MIRFRYSRIIISGITTRNPASTIKSAFSSLTLSKNTLLNSSLVSKSFGEMHCAGIPCLPALSSANAFLLLLITPTICVFVIVPFSTASIIACRFVPPPDTRTATLSIRLLLFLLPLHILPHMVLLRLPSLPS